MVLVLSFFLGHFMPGNPFFSHLTRTTEAQYNKVLEMSELYGVNLPITEQFLLYLRNFFTGNWGQVWSRYLGYRMDVGQLILFTFPRTLELMGLSMILALFLGKFFGRKVFSQKKKTQNTFIRFLLILMSSIPVLLSGFGIQLLLNKTPLREYTFGLSTDNQFPARVTGMALVDCLIGGDLLLFVDIFLHYLLPVLILSLPMTVLISQHVRSSVLDAMNSDFVRTARAKGVPEKNVLNRHIMPNSMNSTITTLGMAFPLFFVNAALVEMIFRLSGVASLVIRALIYHDFNVIVASFTYISLIITIGNFLADIIYGILDPRLRYLY